MSAGEMLEVMAKYAIEYSKGAQGSLLRNKHMNEVVERELVSQRHIDAVLVDFINHIGARHGIDYALYTSDLGNSE